MENNGGLQIRERAYRMASQANDYLVAGTSILLFVTALLLFEAGGTQPVRVVGVVAVSLLALSVIVGLMKLEHVLAVLGADFTMAVTETNATDLTVRESTAVLRDLKETIERLSARASLAHRLRNWLLVSGILALVLSRILGIVLTV